MKYLFIILFLFTSCSASWHLKQAIRKGGKVTRDTVIINVPVPADTSVVYDTIYKEVFMDKILRDTLVIDHVKYRTKTLYDTLTNTVYQEVIAKGDTIKVPCIENVIIEEPARRIKWYEWISASLVMILILLVILKVLKLWEHKE